MITVRAWLGMLDRLGYRSASWANRASHAMFFAGLVMVLALSPSSYSPHYRQRLARQIYLGTAPNLGWFVLIGAIVCVVLIRVVLVSALSYGLSRYALELMIRLLVLELMPLAAAIFVALRCTLPFGQQIAHLQDPDIQLLRGEILPRVLAGMFAVVALVTLSGVTALALIYLAIHGFTGAGVDTYTRMIGQVFEPSVALVFVLKTLSLAAVVALAPVASGHYEARERGARAASATPGAQLHVMVQLFVLVLAIEVVSLIANYY